MEWPERGFQRAPAKGDGEAGLVALTSPDIVPEMVFAGTPLKCLWELDRA